MNTSNKWKLELLMAKIKKTDLESLTDQQIKEFFECKDINTVQTKLQKLTSAINKANHALSA